MPDAVPIRMVIVSSDAPAKIDTDRDLVRARKVARVLDQYLVDPVLGLVLPGVGDILGAILGLYIVAIAARRKISPVVIARMLLNLGVDAVIGIIPLLGDITDFNFKANMRNIRLLESRSAGGGRAKAADWALVIGAGLAFVALLALMIWAISAILRSL
jgi:hypothetical protein